MSLRAALSILALLLLAGCVSGGASDPLANRQGRADAGRAYTQLGLGYLQQGLTQQAKAPLAKALALDAADADTHAAMALVFQAEGEPALAQVHFEKRLQPARAIREFATTTAVSYMLSNVSPKPSRCFAWPVPIPCILSVRGCTRTLV